MLRFLAAVFALIAFAVQAGNSSPAKAEIYYPWCANYSGDMGGASNCGFSTLEQCRATISGIGGFCDPNPFYVDAAKSDRSSRKRAHR
jgi:hypothetical protein